MIKNMGLRNLIVTTFTVNCSNTLTKALCSKIIIFNLEVTDVDEASTNGTNMNATNREIDCGPTVCEETFRFKEVCKTYISTGLPGCQVPCDVRTCQVTIHENVLCPIWSCYDKTTTTAPWTTLAPSNSSASFCQTNPTCISSLSFNGIFGIVLLSILAMLFKKRYRSRPRRAFIDDVESGVQTPSQGGPPTTASAPPDEQHEEGNPGFPNAEQHDEGATGFSNPGYQDETQAVDQSSQPKRYSNLGLFLKKKKKPKPPIGLDANILAESP